MNKSNQMWRTSHTGFASQSNALDNQSNQGVQATQTSQGATLKGKLLNLDALINDVVVELSLHRKEYLMLKAEKDSLENILTIKNQDVQKSLMNELMRLDDETKRHIVHQKGENSRLQQQLTQLNAEKIIHQQQLQGLQGRIAELEVHIGNSEKN